MERKKAAQETSANDETTRTKFEFGSISRDSRNKRGEKRREREDGDTANVLQVARCLWRAVRCSFRLWPLAFSDGGPARARALAPPPAERRNEEINLPLMPSSFVSVRPPSVRTPVASRRGRVIPERHQRWMEEGTRDVCARIAIADHICNKNAKHTLR